MPGGWGKLAEAVGPDMRERVERERRLRNGGPSEADIAWIVADRFRHIADRLSRELKQAKAAPDTGTQDGRAEPCDYAPGESPQGANYAPEERLVADYARGIFVKTGEDRVPQDGEWYLGARPLRRTRILGNVKAVVRYPILERVCPPDSEIVRDRRTEALYALTGERRAPGDGEQYVGVLAKGADPVATALVVRYRIGSYPTGAVRIVRPLTDAERQARAQIRRRPS